jgi:hypothetical protein
LTQHSLLFVPCRNVQKEATDLRLCLPWDDRSDHIHGVCAWLRSHSTASAGANMRVCAVVRDKNCKSSKSPFLTNLLFHPLVLRCALIWFSLSYVPFGHDMLKGVMKSCAGAVCGS